MWGEWRYTVPIGTCLGTRWRFVENCTHRRFAPGKRTLFVLLEEEAGWVSEPVWSFWREKNLLFLSGIESHFCAQGVNERENGKLFLSVSSFCLVCNISGLQMVSVSTLKCIKHSFVSYTSNILVMSAWRYINSKLVVFLNEDSSRKSFSKKIHPLQSWFVTKERGFILSKKFY